MSPEELYQRSGDILRFSNTEGITEPEDIRLFVESLRQHLVLMHEWAPPVYGSIGYADSQVIDLIRQLKFQSENVQKNFPNGMEALYAALRAFRQFLEDHYPIPKSVPSDFIIQ